MRIEKIIAQALEHLQGDRYKLSLVVSKRAEQLASGDKPLISADINKVKLTDIALMEIAQGKIELDTFLNKS